ncbi:universal stress protein, partial [Streptomyces nigra]
MARTITVGLDGSSESRAAAEWAAREATLRQVPVRLGGGALEQRHQLLQRVVALGTPVVDEVEGRL